MKKIKIKILVAFFCVLSLSHVGFSYSILEREWRKVVYNPRMVFVQGSAPNCNEMPFGPYKNCPVGECPCSEHMSNCEEEFTEACEETAFWAKSVYLWCMQSGGSEDMCDERAENFFNKNIVGPAEDFYGCVEEVPCVPCEE